MILDLDHEDDGVPDQNADRGEDPEKRDGALDQLVARVGDDSLAAPLDNLLATLSAMLRSMQEKPEKQVLVRAAITLAFIGDDESRSMIRV